MSSHIGVQTTRDRILAAARALLEDRGFDVGMGEIARQAGISRQAVYLHFESKADLLRQLTTWVEEHADLGTLLAPVFDAPDGEAALKALLHAGAVFEPQIHALARATEQVRDRDDQVRAITADRMARRLTAMKAVVARIEAEDRLKPGWDVDTAAAFVWLTTSPPSYHAMVVDLGWTVERWAEATFRLLRDAFINPRRTPE
jgi:AcrR family transcriptional regulator